MDPEPTPAPPEPPPPPSEPPRHRLRIKHWLVLAATIGTLVIAGLLIMTFGFGEQRKQNREIELARKQVYQLMGAVEAFLDSHGLWIPMTTNAVLAAAPDFVFGTVDTGADVELLQAGDGYQANNSEVLRFLLNPGLPSADRVHKGKLVEGSDDPRAILDPPKAADNRSPGLGPDGVYRDPWGSPYILTLDVDGDYVAMGHYAGAPPPPPLHSSSTTGDIDQQSDYFCAQLRVIVWSLGPDRKADPSLKWNEGVNADNIYSWR
jgi:hypothetical protein